MGDEIRAWLIPNPDVDNAGCRSGTPELMEKAGGRHGLGRTLKSTVLFDTRANV